MVQVTEQEYHEHYHPYLAYQLYQEGNKDKANELLDDLAMNILYDEKSQNQDPFWEKTSADYFCGLSLGLFEDAKEEEINLLHLKTTAGPVNPFISVTSLVCVFFFITFSS